MSYSKVILVGRLGADPEVRFTTTGTAVANVNIAVDAGWGDRKRTDWHRLVVFSKAAESLGQHARKGSLLLVEGSLQNREWQDKEGQKRMTTEVLVDRWIFAGPKQDQGQPQGQSQSQSYGGDDDGSIPF